MTECKSKITDLRRLVAELNCELELVKIQNQALYECLQAAAPDWNMWKAPGCLFNIDDAIKCVKTDKQDKCDRYTDCKKICDTAQSFGRLRQTMKLKP